MKKYNTFLVIDTKTRKPILVTGSPKIASKYLRTGRKVEVWNGHKRVNVIYKKNEIDFFPLLMSEKVYHQQKQERAESKNNRRER